MREIQSPAQALSPPTPFLFRHDAESQGLVAGLPIGFQQLAVNGLLCTEVLTAMASFANVFQNLTTSRHLAINAAISPLYGHVRNIVTSVDLSPVETQLCHGLLALCLTLMHQFGIDFSSTGPSSSTSESPTEMLDAVAEAFLCKKLADADLSPLHHACLLWTALGLGTACFRPFEGATHQLRMKGHIILTSITENLLPRTAEDKWAAIEDCLGGRYWWPQPLVEKCKHTFWAAANRQRDWEARGLLKIGMPNDDKIEYMVMRGYRGKFTTPPSGSPGTLYWGGHQCHLADELSLQARCPSSLRSSPDRDTTAAQKRPCDLSVETLFHACPVSRCRC